MIRSSSNMKLLICCAAGMSSSLLVKKMRDEAKRRQLEDMKIGACSLNQLHLYINEADILLLAPQINYMMEELDTEIPIFHITNEEYGTLNADKIIERILEGNQQEKTENLNKRYIALQHFFVPLAKKISTNIYLDSINRSFTSILPITMVGSFFLMLGNLPFTPLTDFFTNLGLIDVFNAMNNATLQIISLYLVFFIAYHFVRSQNQHGHPAALLALICFFLVTGRNNGIYSLEYLGAKGIFAAIFIAFLTSRLYLLLIEKISFQLPNKLPSQLTRSLQSILPSLIIISLFTIIAGCTYYTSYENLHEFFYATIQQTLSKYLGNNILSFVFFQFMVNILWFFGLHGGNIVSTITNPIYIPLSIENFDLFSQGLQPINIISSTFSKCFISGGAGSMFSLSLLMTFFSKSEQYKTLGKISLPTTFFFINEPLLFGIPVIMNLLYFIPLMITTPFLSLLTYYVMKIGLVPIPIGIQLPWTTPPIFYGMIQGGVTLAIWEAITILIAMLIWYPFFKIGDKEAFDKENNKCHN